MRAFKILWQSKKESWHWVAFEINSGLRPLFFNFHRNGYATQWFCNLNIFPFYLLKNNCNLKIGISFFFFYIALNFQTHFECGIRKKQQKDLYINWF